MSILERIINADTNFSGLAPSVPEIYEGPTEYEAFLNGSDDSDQMKMLFVMYCSADSLINDTDISIIGDEDVKIPVAADASNPTDDEVKAINDAREDNADYAQTREELSALKPKCMQWLIDLCACHQVKKMSNANVKGYFESTGGVIPNCSEVITLLNWAAPSLCKITGNEAAFAKVHKQKFTEYHTSVSSSASVCKRFIDSIPKNCTHIISNSERTAVENAKADPHKRELDDLIPERVKALATIFHEVNEMDIGTYYQGQKAVAAMPATDVIVVRQFFKQLSKMKKKSSKVEKAVSVNDLMCSFPAPIDGVSSEVSDAATADRAKLTAKVVKKANKNKKEGQPDYTEADVDSDLEII